MADLEISQAALTHKLQSYADEVAALKAALRAKETAFTTQAAQVQYYRETLKNMKFGKEEVSTRSVHDQLTCAHLKIGKLETDFNERVLTMKGRIAQLETQKVDAEGKCSLTQTENARLRAAFNKGAKENASLKKENEDLQHEIASISAEKHSIEANFSDLLQAHSDTERDLLKRRAEVSNLRSDQELCRQTAKVSSHLPLQHNGSEQLVAAGKHQIALTALNEKEEEISGLRETALGLQSKVDRLETEVKFLTDDKRLLEKDIIMSEAARMACDLGGIEAELRVTKEKLDAEREISSGLRVDIKLAKALEDTLRKASTEQKALSEKLTLQLKQLHLEIIEREQGSAEQLKKERRDSYNRSSCMEITLQKCQARVVEMLESERQREVEMERMQREGLALTTANEGLRAEVLDLEAALLNVTKARDDLVSDLANERMLSEEYIETCTRLENELTSMAANSEDQLSEKIAAFEEDLAAMASRVSALQEQLALANKERAKSSEESAELLQRRLSAETAAMEEMQEKHRLLLDAESLRHASELAALEERLKRKDMEHEDAVRECDVHLEELTMRVASLAAEKNEVMELAAHEESQVVKTLQEELRALQEEHATTVANTSLTVKVVVV